MDVEVARAADKEGEAEDKCERGCSKDEWVSWAEEVEREQGDAVAMRSADAGLRSLRRRDAVANSAMRRPKVPGKMRPGRLSST